MSWKIFLCADHSDTTSRTNGTGAVYNWLDFNCIEFETVSFWSSSLKDFEFSFDYENSILICSQPMFSHLLSLNRFKDQLIEFGRCNNQLWVTGTDIAMKLLDHSTLAAITRLDHEINSSGVVLFIDATVQPDCYIANLKNIKIVEMFNTFDMFATPRIQSNCVKYTQPTYDYLLTAKKKPGREHRDILIDNLNQRPQLKNRGLISYTGPDAPWLGSTTHQHNWQDGHASMDLYNNCYLEIVPETCYKNLHMMTEKTQKPIMTYTPFLMVSTTGFLQYLHNQGFKTFDSLIDERYDQYPNINDRITHMLDVLEHIVDNGTSEFYNASHHILEHNFSRLCEISGRWDHEFDRMMWRALDNFEQLISKKS